MRVARRVKSLSLETRQKPPNSRVWSKSIASMMRALSLAFLPTVLRNCWTGCIACSSNTVRQPCRFVVVKSPYTRLTLAVPSDATSERISPITEADALSASMRTARRRESSGILSGLPLFLTAYLALRRLSSDNRSAPPRQGNGETERAAAELTEARRLSSDDRYSSLARNSSPVV